MTGHRICLLLVLVLFAAQLGWYAARLPERMVVNFDFSGEPDGFGARDGYFFGHAVTVLLLAGLFTGLPMLLRRLPARLVNLPNPDYWLAPERRDATMDWIGAGLSWFGVWTLVLVLYVTQLAILANFAEPVRMNATAFLAGLGAYLL